MDKLEVRVTSAKYAKGIVQCQSVEVYIHTTKGHVRPVSFPYKCCRISNILHTRSSMSTIDSQSKSTYMYMYQPNLVQL